jgi:hypothetical protein
MEGSRMRLLTLIALLVLALTAGQQDPYPDLGKAKKSKR